ncbi:tetraspanin family protein [Lacticaseibacillus pantheris]|nr:tetraspanin family protein [Lacticaseibacillus pantheris]
MYTLFFLVIVVALICGLVLLIMGGISTTNRHKYLRWSGIAGIALVAGIVLFLVSMPKDPDTSASKNQEAQASKIKADKNSSKKAAKKAKQAANLAKINKEIAHQLWLDKGWAKGTLDDNGNQTQTDPDDAFTWALSVRKITYHKDGTLKVLTYVGFYNNSDDQKTSDAISAINSADASIQKITGKKKDADLKYTTFWVGKQAFGHSMYSDYRHFTWYTI